jgi:N-acetylglucosaminyldiphosphoundecaprenol N-acetyl-beta-D-mannosaminyltransferase
MKKYFNILLEFNHEKLEKKVIEIANSSNKNGYACFVDLNSLVYANKHFMVMEVINKATVNSCDGSYIAMAASKLHKKKYKEYIGPDFFKKFIFTANKHLIIGNTETVFNKVKEKVTEKKQTDMHYLSLPFKNVEDFDYEGISDYINNLSPDYIWVSLGAPKQELFMSFLVNKLNRGMLLGVGAALNYFSGEIKDIPDWTKKLHIIWVYRIFTEPKKQFKRMAKVFLEFPKIYKSEKKKINNG